MFIAPIILLATFLMLGTTYAQSPGSGYGPPPQQGGWYCPYGGPYQGGYGMGPGMMGYYGMGYGMGPGMMGYGRGYGMGYGMMGPGYGYYPRYRQPNRPLKKQDAKEIVENYLNSTRNPNLKLGKIKDEGSAFEAEIVTKSNGSLVDKVLVNKDTGWMRSVY
jgi:hypothetical protein